MPIWFEEAGQPHVDTAGSTILFNPVGPDLVLVSLRDTTQIEVLDKLGFGRPAPPRLSPDGQQIATLLRVGVGSEVYVYDRDTRTDRLAASLPDYGVFAVVHWFAGNDSLLLQGSTTGTGGIDYRVVRLDGSGSAPFRFSPVLNAEVVALSDDERWLAIGRPVAPGQTRDHAETRVIHVYDLLRGVRTRVVQLSHDVWHLAWSPDGRYLAHTPSPFVEREAALELIEVETGTTTALVPSGPGTPGANFPTWVK